MKFAIYDNNLAPKDAKVCSKNTTTEAKEARAEYIYTMSLSNDEAINVVIKIEK